MNSIWIRTDWDGKTATAAGAFNGKPLEVEGTSQAHAQLIASLQRRAEARKGRPGYLALLQRLQDAKHAVLREGE